MAQIVTIARFSRVLVWNCERARLEELPAKKKEAAVTVPTSPPTNIVVLVAFVRRISWVTVTRPPGLLKMSHGHKSPLRKPGSCLQRRQSEWPSTISHQSTSDIQSSSNKKTNKINNRSACVVASPWFSFVAHFERVGLSRKPLPTITPGGKSWYGQVQALRCHYDWTWFARQMNLRRHRFGNRPYTLTDSL